MDEVLLGNITKKFKSGATTKSLAEEFNLHVSSIRRLLKSNLGLTEYSKIKERNLLPIRKRFSEIGIRAIRTKMEDKAFAVKWSEKCSLGGHITKNNRKGIFDPVLQKYRTQWSILGLRKTGKKLVGPLGEKMYTDLEVRVAKRLLKQNLYYEYEKKVPANNVNGFYSLDFVVSTYSLVIEVTNWDDIEQKAKELKSKFSNLYEDKMFSNFILVTRSCMADKYKRLLPHYILVLIPSELESALTEFSVKK